MSGMSGAKDCFSGINTISHIDFNLDNQRGFGDFVSIENIERPECNHLATASDFVALDHYRSFGPPDVRAAMIQGYVEADLRPETTDQRYFTILQGNGLPLQVSFSKFAERMDKAWVEGAALVQGNSEMAQSLRSGYMRMAKDYDSTPGQLFDEIVVTAKSRKELEKSITNVIRDFMSVNKEWSSKELVQFHKIMSGSDSRAKGNRIVLRLPTAVASEALEKIGDLGTF